MRMVPPGSHLSSKVHFIIARILVALGLIRWGRQTWVGALPGGRDGCPPEARLPPDTLGDTVVCSPSELVSS